jgi:hypothetical protein
MAHTWFLTALTIAAHQDTTIIAAVRATATRERVEVFKTEKGLVPVRDIQLLDVDGDGSPEAFVSIEPTFRQTPTILVYTYDRQRGARHLLEGLVPGQLQPVSGRFSDDHTIGFGVDMTVGEDGKPVDFDRLLAAAVTNRMSLVKYRTFLHADGRKDFVSFVDLSDRVLPTPGTKTCQDFEFSPVDALAAGTLAGTGSTRYLVALTASDITIYRFRGVRSNGTLDKEVWIRPKPTGATGLRVSPNDEVQLATSDGRGVPLIAP